MFILSAVYKSSVEIRTGVLSLRRVLMTCWSDCSYILAVKESYETKGHDYLYTDTQELGKPRHHAPTFRF
jgi:hypothetical protein